MYDEERAKQAEDFNTIWQDWQACLSYQRSIKLPETVAKCVDFYEGRQWPPATKETATFPRPVINMVKFLARNKAAAMNNSPVRIIYASDSGEAATDKVTRFANHIAKEMEMAKRDAEAIKNGVIKGTYIHHYYWDREAIGRRGTIEGGLRCENLDVRNVGFANPLEPDEQKQEYILIASRVPVRAVRAMCAEGVDRDLIVPDEGEGSTKGKETKENDDGNKLCTVITKYYRKNGEVYCLKCTKTALIAPPFALQPNIVGAKGGSVAPADTNVAENPSRSIAPSSVVRKAYLYPIAVGQYDQRDGCIYGLSEIEGIIPAQRTINSTWAMAAYDIQSNAWGKYLVKKDALNGQKITNTPGEVLVDYSATGDGIKQMPARTITETPMRYADNLMSALRVVTGATEVMTGESIGANMSGSAIAQLQSQASKPIEELRKNFWTFKEKCGKIILQAFRLYYNVTTPYTYDMTLDNGQELPEDLRGAAVRNKDGSYTIKDTFNAEDYINTDFSVVAKAQSGTESSPAGDIAILDVLLSKGAIDALRYVQGYPDQALSDKDNISRLVESMRGDELGMLKAQIAQLSSDLAAAAQKLDVQNKTYAKAADNERMIKSLEAMIVDLRKELNDSKEKFGQTVSDAQMFAQRLRDIDTQMPAQTEGTDTMPIDDEII